jgi:hypothetical protein
MATCRGKDVLASGLKWAEGVLTIGAEGYNATSTGQNQKRISLTAQQPGRGVYAASRTDCEGLQTLSA